MQEACDLHMDLIRILSWEWRSIRYPDPDPF